MELTTTRGCYPRHFGARDILNWSEGRLSEVPLTIPECAEVIEWLARLVMEDRGDEIRMIRRAEPQVL